MNTVNINDHFQQGDVTLTRVDKKQASYFLEGIKGKRIAVLQHGEATGHSHRLEGKGFKVYETWRDKFIEITKTVNLVHEEHNTITLPLAFIGSGLFESMITLKKNREG